MEYIKIQFSNASNIGDIYYVGGFTQWFWCRATEIYPIPEIEEEGEEDSNGDFVPTFQRVITRYGVEIYAQPFLAEALSLLPLHDTKQIIFKNNLSADLDKVEVTVEPLANMNCLAKVVIKFSVLDGTIIKRGC